MKLGIVYTSTTPELIECVNEEIKKNLGDAPEILNYQDPSILAEVREHGYVTAGAAARLVAVSYTHLDVYKRQPQRYCRSLQLPPAPAPCSL